MTLADLLALDRALTPQERKRLRARDTAKGYAALPGTGPAGETCGSCANLARNRVAKVYLKCGLMRAIWTGGAGTDVRARSPACRRWERAPEPVRVPRALKPRASHVLEPPPPTMRERADAAIAARALRAAAADPAAAGAPATVFLTLARPRRGERRTSWANLPGLVRVNDAYHHALLPGWQYARAEIAAEMIPDLEALAERGVRPTEATTPAAEEIRP